MRYAQLTANFYGKVRREKLQGREYLVAPLSLIVPGVLNGSQGPLYYPLDEVSKNPEKWNGIPIVVDHPQRNGRFISARDPEVLNESCIGMVLKANTKRKKLAAEAWFDVKNCLRINPQILRDVEKGRPREVSTGLHTKNEPSKGVFNGMAYSAIARNYTPDHLAILTTDQGACSLKDGCGVNVNQNCGIGSEGFEQGNDCAKGKGGGGKKSSRDTARIAAAEGEKEYQRRKRLKELPPDSPERIKLREKKRKKLIDDFNKGHLPGPKKPEVFDMVGYLSSGADMKEKYEQENLAAAKKRAKRKLTGNTDGECQCKSCRKKRKSQQGSGPSVKEPMMANKKSEKERKGLIDNLIGNCACEEKAWTEEDRPILNALSDEKLVALDKHREAVANALAEKNEEEEEEEVTTTNKQNGPPKEKTAKEWMAEAPPEIRSIVGNAMRRENEHRANLITTITANESNPFSKEELNTEPTEKLEKLAKAFSPKEESHSFIPPAPLYTGAAAPLGNSRSPSATDISEFRKRNQDMVPPTVNFKEEFDKRVKQHA